MTFAHTHPPSRQPTHTHTHTARFGGLFRALRRSLAGHIALLWLWLDRLLWLWLRRF
jgi:hypothetical protein